MNLINAKTEQARKISINQLSGKVSNKIKILRNELIQIISNIEVNIDYPEYEDIEIITTEKILPNIKKFKNELINIIKESENGKILNDGINVGIIGKPNVGKSSLLNELLEEEKAIVTDIEGTTRDIVEGKITLDGLNLNIIDTAGIRETDNVVEKIGVEKSLDIINTSDLIIFMLNNNEEITKEELKILDKVKIKPNIIVINKIDLPTKLKLPIKDNETIKVSLKEGKNIEKITDEIKKIYNLEKIETSDLTYLSDARSISLLKQALSKINLAIKNIEDNSPIDIVELDLKNSWELLGQIIGETYTEELMDELFSRFCLGK